MNILYVCHYFLPFSVGGTEEHTWQVAREMRRRGHSVEVFHGLIGRPELAEHQIVEHCYDGLPCTAIVVDLREIDDFRGTWNQAPVEEAFERFLGARRFDLAHVQHLTRLSLGLVDRLQARGIPVLLSLHDYWMQCARGQRVRPDGVVCARIDDGQCAGCMALDVDFLDRRKPEAARALVPGGPGTPARHRHAIELRRREMLRCLDGATQVLTASRFVAAEHRAYGMSRDVDVQGYGVDEALLEGYVETRTRRLRFGFVGRMEPTKGVEILLDAFRRVRGDAELHLHGTADPERLSALRAAAARDARVVFHGPFERAHLAQVYQTFDVQVIPSTWLECSPLVFQTALLFRKPMVVSDLGGLAELADVAGLRFRPGDAAHLAEILGHLIESPGRVDELRAALPSPKPFSAYADELEGRYRRLSEAR